MRKVCVVVGSRANYSSIKSAMRAIQAHPDLELQVVASAPRRCWIASGRWSM